MIQSLFERKHGVHLGWWYCCEETRGRRCRRILGYFFILFLIRQPHLYLFSPSGFITITPNPCQAPMFTCSWSDTHRDICPHRYTCACVHTCPQMPTHMQKAHVQPSDLLIMLNCWVNNKSLSMSSLSLWGLCYQSGISCSSRPKPRPWSPAFSGPTPTGPALKGPPG